MVYQQYEYVVKSLYDPNEASVFFWINTIVCPVAHRESKDLALELMGKTYKNAHKVLLLDSSLMVLNA